MELPDRILSKIDKTHPCWRWLQSHTAIGRPQVFFEGKNWIVYRLLYTVEMGPIPEGMTLDHLCQNGWCCNPAHCEPVSGSENTGRALAIRWAGVTECPQGHPYAEYRRYRKRGKAAGRPYCLACGNERVREWTRKRAINK